MSLPMARVILSTSPPGILSLISASVFAKLIFMVTNELTAIFASSAFTNSIRSMGGELVQMRLCNPSNTVPAFASDSPIRMKSGSSNPRTTSPSAMNSGL